MSMTASTHELRMRINELKGDKWYLVDDSAFGRYYRVDTQRKVTRVGTDYYFWWKVEKYRGDWWVVNEIVGLTSTGRKAEFHTLTDALVWALRSEGLA